MSQHRFFLTEPLPAAEEFVVPLSSADLHHAVSVLRVHAGEQVDVVEPGGRVLRVTVTDASREALLAAEPQPVAAAETGMTTRVTLVFGVSKGAKNDDIVEGAVEVGADELMPVMTARTIVKLDAEKRAERAERWRRIASAAAKQSKRTAVPTVHEAALLADVLPLLSSYDLVLVAWEDADAGGQGVRDAVASVPVLAGARVAVVVGPEGGLTGGEVELLEAIGACTATLGPTIMRAETAAVVAAALTIHELGGLGNRR